ncbi:phosphotransferase system mannose-type iia component [Lucifera butyrica]|uniref:Phosphotransferase system mannose-type iia component n=1 Tax=Lucifera butyrica TaxID=1351585 RepID=A0A498RAT4_9FIRM|nr:PTS galactosamine/N-acetylgalactosamine transporter subunit IIA [Lucifera butyrica]VBB08541.1 phosphotransferase system mannose-type iia component [Lucifera butyrica]
MIGIVITGHGQFATGLSSAVEMIAGKSINVAAVDFGLECSTDELSRQLKQAVNSFENCDKVLFLTDLLGGSPFRCSVLAGSEIAESKVIAGTNLAMALEVVLSRECDNLEQLMEMAITAGKNGVQSYAYVGKCKKHTSTGI